MLKTIASALMSVIALVPAPVKKEVSIPQLSEKDSVIVRVLPHKAARTDGDYLVDDNMQVETKTADERYEELKSALDERFSHMFEIKAQLDKMQSDMSAKWEEYYALRDKYDHELKKIIASWVTENNYIKEQA